MSSKRTAKLRNLVLSVVTPARTLRRSPQTQVDDRWAADCASER